MTRASRGRRGRIALSVLGLLALLIAGVVGARPDAHGHAPAVSIALDAPCCPPDGHARGGHDGAAGAERHAGCAVACTAGAIAPAEPAILEAGLAAVAGPGPAMAIAGRSTRPEPEPPRRATRA